MGLPKSADAPVNGPITPILKVWLYAMAGAPLMACQAMTPAASRKVKWCFIKATPKICTIVVQCPSFAYRVSQSKQTYFQQTMRC
jgi:hypothetical protein